MLSYKNIIPIWWSIAWRYCVVWYLLAIVFEGAYLYSWAPWEMSRLQEIADSLDWYRENWLLVSMGSWMQFLLEIVLSIWAVRAGINKHKLLRTESVEVS